MNELEKFLQSKIANNDYDVLVTLAFIMVVCLWHLFGIYLRKD
jgi:hypothetical protein